MSYQQSQKLVEEAAEIRRRYASETNAEYRAQLTARYYQIEAELKSLRTSAQAKDTEAQSMGGKQRVAASAPTEVSDPFGIRMRMPLGQTGAGASDFGKGKRKLQTVPRPHSFFDFYVAQTSSESLVTAIMACKTVSPVNRYGSELRSQFQLMVSRLERIYGEPSESIDHLEENSKWTAPGQWMLGLMEGERTLYVEWDDGAGIPADLKKIWLLADASSNREGHITLSYESIDYEVDIEAYYAEDDAAL